MAKRKGPRYIVRHGLKIDLWYDPRGPWYKRLWRGYSEHILLGCIAVAAGFLALGHFIGWWQPVYRLVLNVN